jgi:hypothetical protein
MTAVEYVRLHTDADGESHMDSQVIALKTSAFAPPAPPLAVSTMEPATGWRFLSLPAKWVGDYHPAPARLWIFCLAGEMDFQASDGAVFRLKPGGAILLDDTTGKGHRSKVAGDIGALLVAVQL